MTTESSLSEFAAAVIEKYRARPGISPTWVATEVMTLLDPVKASVPIVYSGCHLHIRQVARKLLAHFDPTRQDETAELFSDDLQWRYPSAKRHEDDEPEYVLLDHLSDADYALNIDRLGKLGLGYLRHRDRLEAHWRNKRASAA